MMVFQLADSGNLEEYLRRNNSSLTWDTRIRLATEITRGLAHIHSHGVLHKDLHSGNILIHGGRPLITDFGCSRLTMYNGTRTAFVGRFGPPERLCDGEKHVYDECYDIYSLGAVLWHISSGRAPFSDIILQWKVPEMVCDGKRENPVPGTPPLYIQLYTDCWHRDPSQRPEIENIKSRLLEISQSLPSHSLITTHVESWIMTSSTRTVTSPLTWTLLYRASRDGFKGEDFHRCCDGKGPTVVIVRPRGVDRVIGGFNSRGWETLTDISSRAIVWLTLLSVD